MHPYQFFNLFPPFPRENKVFVAMSFNEIFNKRWETVIIPAIKNVEIDNIPLEPCRVDTKRISDSILTEILTNISNSLIIFADVSTIGKIDNRAMRNGNVMYELGLAHATRLPEDVILFRSDKDELPFDVANVRVNSYDPDNDPNAAIDLVATAIGEAIQEINQKRYLSVKAAAESLDYPSWYILSHTASMGGINPPINSVAHQGQISVISRLLEIGALKTSYLQITSEILTPDLNEQPMEKMLKYHLTPFGDALIKFIGSEMGLLSPEIQPKLEKLLKDDETSQNKKQ